VPPPRSKSVRYRRMAEEAAGPAAPDAAAAPADAPAAAPEDGEAVAEVDDAAVLELLEQSRTPQVVEAIWDGFLERQKEYSQMVAKRSGRPRPETPRGAARPPEELEAGWGQFLSRMEQKTTIAVLPDILNARRTDGSWEYQVRSPRGKSASSPRGKATSWVDGRHLSASPRVEAGTRRTMESLRATARVRAAEQITFADRVRTVELTYGSRPPRPKEKARAKAPKVASRVAGKQALAPAAVAVAGSRGRRRRSA